MRKVPEFLTVRIGAKEIAKIQEIAKREDRSISAVARRLIEQALRNGGKS